MRRTITLLFISGSLFGATALAACGSEDTSSTPAAAAAAKTVKSDAGESAKSKSAASGQTKATIKGFAFAPEQLKVSVGQEITWTNEDSAPHTVTAQARRAAFDSGTLAQGASYTFKATKAGTIEYLCAIHPSMVGTIIVE